MTQNSQYDISRTRRMLAASLRMKGFSYNKIGKIFGISHERARQIIWKHDQEALEAIRAENRTANSPLFKHELIALQKVQDWLHFLTETPK
jgi:hypothetical protein